MGETGFTVDPEELRQFGKGLAQRQDAVNAAAGKPDDSLGTDTFGKILGWCSGIVEGSLRETVQKIKDLGDGIGDAVELVAATGQSYESSEGRNQTRFGR